MLFSIIAIGWLISAYLFMRFTLLAEGTAPSNDLCNTIFGSSCNPLLLSPTSWQLGSPLAGWGLVNFAIIGFILIIGNLRAYQTALYLSVISAGMNCVLAATILFQIVKFCPFCLLINFLCLVLPIAIWKAFLDQNETDTNEIVETNRTLLKRRNIFLITSFIIGILFQFVLVRTGPIIDEQIKRENTLINFQNELIKNIAIDPNSPRLGSANAPVQLVVFSSFQCPACKVFAYTTHYLQDKFKDNISVTYKHFPLSTKCNPILHNDMQPKACDAAYAAFCAHQQGSFWAFHDELFASDLSASEEILEKAANLTNLDITKWQLDRQTTQAPTQVVLDIKTAYELEVSGTPTVFLNGRLVKESNLSTLEFLITKELETLMK